MSDDAGDAGCGCIGCLLMIFIVLVLIGAMRRAVRVKEEQKWIPQR